MFKKRGGGGGIVFFSSRLKIVDIFWEEVGGSIKKKGKKEKRMCFTSKVIAEWHQGTLTFCG